MLASWIMELVFLIAPQYNVPPYLVASIILVESGGNPSAVGYNPNGTIDYGLMSLNSSWYDDPNWSDAASNIRAGCQHLRRLYSRTYRASPNWYAAVISYNCGLGRFLSDAGPPGKFIDYAAKVFKIWNGLDPVRRNLYKEN